MARGSGAEFTGDEGLGRYLDLHEHHQRFVSAHKTFGRKVSLGPRGWTYPTRHPPHWRLERGWIATTST